MTDERSRPPETTNPNAGTLGLPRSVGRVAAHHPSGPEDTSGPDRSQPIFAMPRSVDGMLVLFPGLDDDELMVSAFGGETDDSAADVLVQSDAAAQLAYALMRWLLARDPSQGAAVMDALLEHLDDEEQVPGYDRLDYQIALDTLAQVERELAGRLA